MNNTATAPPGRGLAMPAWCLVAAFGAYFCMYAFRKPFTAAAYSATFGGIEYKTILVIAQTLGYTVSKFVGIRVVAEVKPQRRALLLLGLIGVAEVALLLFAVTPAPWNGLWLFCNGLPLGMVFGLVLGFLEGRRQTEALAAGLCGSFIIADGATKQVGGELLKAGASEVWMPFLAGLLFVPPLLLFVWMLTRIQPPTRQDVVARSERMPMTSAERWGFFWRYAPGLTLLVLVYLLITVMRSVRADFAPEIWKGLRATVEPSLYTRSEVAVAVGVLLLNGAVVFFHDSRQAFFAALSLAAAGPVLIVAALLGLQRDILSPFSFMVLHGLGLYLPYIAVHTTLFERFLAMTRDRGNIGYLMYLADSFGYLGYVLVLLGHNLLGSAENFLSFFLTLSWTIAGACVVLLIPCWYYFATHPKTQRQSAPAPELVGIAETERGR